MAAWALTISLIYIHLLCRYKLDYITASLAHVPLFVLRSVILYTS